MGITSAKTACVSLAIVGWMSIVGTAWAQHADRAVASYESLNEPNLAGEMIATEEARGLGDIPVAARIYSSTNPRHAFDAGYDNGIFLKLQENNDSFELKANFRSQFRLVSFSNKADTWTDNAGRRATC